MRSLRSCPTTSRSELAGSRNRLARLHQERHDLERGSGGYFYTPEGRAGFDVTTIEQKLAHARHRAEDRRQPRSTRRAARREIDTLEPRLEAAVERWQELAGPRHAQHTLDIDELTDKIEALQAQHDRRTEWLARHPEALPRLDRLEPGARRTSPCSRSACHRSRDAFVRTRSRRGWVGAWPMTTPPPSPYRLKVRMVRSEGPPDDLLVVVRATPGVVAAAIDAVVATAAESAGTYVVPRPGGGLEVLFGVSVYALRPGIDPLEVLGRFPYAPAYVAATVGALAVAGFGVLPTGANPDHFDVQLLPGRSEGSAVGAAELRSAAERLLAAAGELRPNPAYAEGADVLSEEE